VVDVWEYRVDGDGGLGEVREGAGCCEGGCGGDEVI
jgi:hypothetical protein